MTRLPEVIPLIEGHHNTSETAHTVFEQVDCSNNELRELPQGLAAASGLLSLKTAHNTLSSLQPELAAAWGNLTSLDISHNSLAALPDTLSCLQRYLPLGFRTHGGHPWDNPGRHQCICLLLSTSAATKLHGGWQRHIYVL